MRASTLLFALAVLAAPPASAQEPVAFEEVRRFAAPEAIQGVAVDDEHFHAIANQSGGKYDKATGRPVGPSAGGGVEGWEGPAGGPILHLGALRLVRGPGGLATSGARRWRAPGGVAGEMGSIVPENSCDGAGSATQERYWTVNLDRRKDEV